MFVTPMARNTLLVKKRNTTVRKRYDELCIKYPKWRDSAIRQELEKEFFITDRTVSAILNNEGTTYGVNQIPITQLALF